MDEHLTVALSKKSRKAKEAILNGELENKDGIKQKKREKSKEYKKTDKADSSILSGVQGCPTGTPKLKTKTKGNDVEMHDPASQTESTASGKIGGKRKRPKERASDIPQDIFTDLERKGKKDEERRRRRTEGDKRLSTTERGGSGYSVEPKKKRRKMGQSGFDNPDEDTSLTDQGRKALMYAYTQFEDPSSWKFNKARQNWLVRNIWSDQKIPDTHISLVNQYLANVQGGVRDNLLKICRAALVTPTAVTPAVLGDTPLDEANQANESSDITISSAVKEAATKQLRARALLGALSASSNKNKK